MRYYVQEGLIPPPLGVGRGNHYTAEHLERVLRVKGMQEAGATLDEIRRALDASVDRQARAGAPHDEPAPARSLWRRIEVAPGVELHLASSVRLPAPGRLRELAEWCRKHFAEQVHSTDEKDEDRDG